MAENSGTVLRSGSGRTPKSTGGGPSRLSASRSSSSCRSATRYTQTYPHQQALQVAAGSMPCRCGLNRPVELVQARIQEWSR
jgi:hypothetical protein